ncbi:tripartite tricarboxylate transporter substrate binding protein [Noviherbaspirillum sp. L7-7A]|uniref:Bug family tripartite tricarboxylate transporter substrate binding protein n=1 Tax=Noviherbaspirillum sp. L7-7A TaxID=2850560 RepID=UPI001C2C66E1|nr:tripartite tricarboxylate transporter substrate binding protein [Noviherbaspirillum sp. L7-7A]MBV0881473.1 tripartite tricarboxylate transporter substrate binding protein [Noviherbaspirillum sp. L7-7A]
MKLKQITGSVVATSLLITSGVAAAEDWPTKPVRVIVAFAPASTPDIVARLVSDKLAQRIGKPVIVENKAGAAGNIGTDAVAKAAPDGYTIGVTISGPLAANTLLFKKLPYNPQTDLEPVTIAATQPSVLVVSQQTSVNDVSALLAKLRSNPGKYNYSSMGTGSISHLAMAALASRSGTEIVHVPYPGSAQAVTAILSGETQMAVLPAAAVMPHVRAGKLKAVAVATAKRSTVLPDLPTLAEAGVQDIQGDAWIGFVAPAKTPAAIVTKLQTEIAQIVNSEDIKQKLKMQFMEPVGGTPAEFRATVQSDLARWQPVIKANNITLD